MKIKKCSFFETTIGRKCRSFVVILDRKRWFFVAFALLVSLLVWQSVTFTLAAVGAMAWAAPWVFKKFTKPQLKGRIISMLDNKGTYRGEPCLLNFIALNVVSLHKTFNIADVEVEVVYEGSAEPYSGHWGWVRPDMSEWVDSNGAKYRCHITPEDTLPYVGSLPTNKTKTVYLFFTVDKDELAKIEKLTIRLIEHTGLVQDIVVESDDLKPNQLVWDYRIWQEIKCVTENDKMT